MTATQKQMATIRQERRRLDEWEAELRDQMELRRRRMLRDRRAANKPNASTQDRFEFLTRWVSGMKRKEHWVRKWELIDSERYPGEYAQNRRIRKLLISEGII